MAAQRYGASPRLRSREIDWVLMDAALFHELDRRDSDLRRYLRAARLHYVLKFVLVYIALPLLGYLLFWADGEPVPTGWLVAWLIVAVLHGLGAPFRWHDLKRARQLRQQYRDLNDLLGRPGISPATLQSALRQAAAEGVLLDRSVYGLVDSLAADGTAPADPLPTGPETPATAGAGVAAPARRS